MTKWSPVRRCCYVTRCCPHGTRREPLTQMHRGRGVIPPDRTGSHLIFCVMEIFMERFRLYTLSRREFLQESALAASALGLASASEIARAQEVGTPPHEAPKAEPLSIGVIGPGSQGQFDLRKVIRVPGVRCVAACDIF